MKHSGTLHSVSYMNTVHSMPNERGCYRKIEIGFCTRVQKCKHLMFLKSLISALVLQFSKTEAHSNFSPSYQPTLTQMLNSCKKTSVINIFSEMRTLFDVS